MSALIGVDRHPKYTSYSLNCPHPQIHGIPNTYTFLQWSTPEYNNHHWAQLRQSERPSLSLLSAWHICPIKIETTIVWKHFTVWSKTSSWAWFLANNLKSSMYSKWLIVLLEVTWYPPRQSSNKHKGFKVIQNDKGLSVSSWNIPNSIETLDNLVTSLSGIWRFKVVFHKVTNLSIHSMMVDETETTSNNEQSFCGELNHMPFYNPTRQQTLTDFLTSLDAKNDCWRENGQCTQADQEHTPSELDVTHH